MSKIDLTSKKKWKTIDLSWLKVLEMIVSMDSGVIAQVIPFHFLK